MRLKYRNKPTVFHGIRFDSKREADRYATLLMYEKTGVISDLQTQPKYDILINGIRVCYYKADFEYVQDGKRVVEDVKSPVTAKNPVYRLKKKLMLACHGIEIQEVM